MSELLDPTNDWMFKHLFGVEERKNLTISLLNDLFDGLRPKIVDIDFIPPNLDKSISVLRPSIVDVRCKCSNGDIFITEMQRDRDDYFLNRLVAYASQAYLNQRPKSKKEDGDRGGYDKMHPVVVVAIVNYTIWGDDNDYLSHDVFVKFGTNTQRLKHFSFTFLELDKFKKTADQLHNNIDKWAYFFKSVGGESFDEMVKLYGADPVFDEALQTLDISGYTEEEYMEYLRYEMKADEIRTMQISARAEGRAEGKAEGLAEGIEKGKIEIARNLLSLNLSLEKISQACGLTLDEIKALQK